MTTPHPRRRFFRYSLRTLMLVVTVFCVWIGIIAMRARDQRLVVQAILDAGGSVFYEHQAQRAKTEPPGPRWLRQLIGDEYFFRVRTVVLFGPKVNDMSLEMVSRFSKLKDLYLVEAQITDAGLEHLRGLTNLRTLNFANARITDAGLVHLEGMTNLTNLSLVGHTKTTDEGVMKLQQALPNLRISR